jgi:hypothetical protein
MALDIDNQSQSRRPLGFVVIGIALLIFSGYLFYDLEQQKSDSVYVPSSHQYTVKQSVDTDVTYFDNSFFKNGPGPIHAAYVMDLTDKINASFDYSLSSNDMIDATYTYDIKGSALGKYAIGANEDKTANVWSKEYQLVAPVTQTVSTKNIKLTPESEMPYAEYKQAIDSFKTALALSLNSEAAMTMTVKVEGTIGGVPFTDTRVTSVTAPLDTPIYTLAVKYDKEDTKHVVGETAKNNREQFQRYLFIFAGVVGVLGMASLLYGLRKQIFKTPYQRELDRIFRYNDGIIIRAKSAADISGKRIVPVLSFDDMLNLEEELKLPIVASPAGPEATKFIIIRDDVAYVFTLGKLLIEDEQLQDIEEEIDLKKPRHRKAK